MGRESYLMNCEIFTTSMLSLLHQVAVDQRIVSEGFTR